MIFCKGNVYLLGEKNWFLVPYNKLYILMMWLWWLSNTLIFSLMPHFSIFGSVWIWGKRTVELKTQERPHVSDSEHGLCLQLPLRDHALNFHLGIPWSERELSPRTQVTHHWSFLHTLHSSMAPRLCSCCRTLWNTLSTVLCVAGSSSSFLRPGSLPRTPLTGSTALWLSVYLIYHIMLKLPV